MSLTATGSQLAWHDPGAADEDKCCCGSDEDCCLYSAASFEAELFGEDDLPATLRLTTTSPISFLVVSGLSLTRSGSTYINGLWKLDVYMLGWRLSYDETEVAMSNCLIGDFSVSAGLTTAITEDDFPASLSFPWSTGTITMNRDSLCKWSYSGGECPSEEEPTEPVESAYLLWNAGDCQWQMTVVFWEGNSTAGDCFTTDYIVSTPKDSGNQSSPDGTYGELVVSP